MKKELLIKNQIVFPLIGLARNPDENFFRSDKKISQYLLNLVNLYSRHISSGEKKLAEVLDDIKSSFYSKEYQDFFIQQLDKKEVLDIWDIIDLDSLIQGYKTTNRDFEKYTKWENDKKNNENSTFGFFGRDFNSNKIDYYCLKLGFDNYTQAKRCGFDISKKEDLNNIPVIEQIVETIKDSHESIFNEVQKIKKSIDKISSNSNPSPEITKKISSISNKINSLKKESNYNFEVLERNRNDANSQLLENQSRINSLLENISNDVNKFDEIKDQIDKTKEEIIQNQYDSSKRVFKLIKKSYLTTLGVGISIAISLIIIFKPPFYQKLENYLKYQFISFESKDPNTYKILILPFIPNKDCQIENTKYEDQLESRYHELKDKYNFNTQVIFADFIKPPKNIKEAKKIGNDKRADIVIWGEYIEECEDLTQMSIKYLSLNDINTGISYLKDRDKLFGESGIKSLDSLVSLKHGYLQKDIDYIINWSLLNSMFKTKNYNKFIPLLKIMIKENKFIDTRLFIAMARNSYNSGLKKDVFFYYQMAFKSELKIKNKNGIGLDKALELSDTRKSDVLFQLWLEMAYVLKKEKKNKSAIKILNKLTKDRSDSSMVWAFLGRLLLDNNENSKAIEVLKKSIKLDSKNITSLNTLGLAQYYNGNLKDALIFYNKAIKIDSSNTLIMNNIGQVYLQQNKFPEALAVLDKSSKLNPNSELIWSNKGIVHLKLKEWNNALSCFNKSLKIKPNNSKILTTRGVSLINLNRKEEARASFLKAIRVDIKNFKAHYFHGKTYSEDKDFYSLAFSSYVAALEGKPNYKEVWYDMGILLLKADKKDQALKTYIEFSLKAKFMKDLNLKRLSNNQLSYTEMAMICFKKAGKYPKALSKN